MSQIKLAINGGEPVFNPALPLIHPVFHNFNEYKEKFSEVFSSGQLTKGKNLRSLEEKLEQYIGVKHVVAVSSGTMGLIATLSALGIGSGDEVLLPSFTFCATAHAVAFLGADIVFVDCNISDFTISVSDLKRKISKKTKAIIGVHIFGSVANVEELEKISKEYKIPLVFDAAHGMGAEYKNIKVGNFGTAEVFSCSPTKTFITGEGGLIATDDDALCEKIKLFREYGNPGDYDCTIIGLNTRMNEVSALTGLMSLETLEVSLSKRRQVAQNYLDSLSDIDGISFQEPAIGVKSNYKDFAILVDREKFGLGRDELSEILSKEGIPTRKYFYPPVHKMVSYKKYNNLTLPNTEEISNNVLCFPIYSDLTKEQIKKSEMW